MDTRHEQQVADLFKAALDYAPTERSTFLKSACRGELWILREVEALLASDATAERFLEPGSSAAALNPPAVDRVETLFHQARTLTGPERQAFLNRECGSDAALRARLEALLKSHDEPGSFLGHGIETFKDEDGKGGMIGPYRLLERIGEGGFGEVWVADQKTPVRRRVALKILKPGMDTREVLTRFEAERQALAMMDHPNVAKVFDAGATETGRPYFVMDLVAGQSITQYCDTARLRTRERLELFICVCQAVQHAHTKGIIHRDLKPSNILVTAPSIPPLTKGGLGGVGMPKVIDFGIAKATTGRLTDHTLYTELGRLMGTPEYMSPEQAGTSGLDVDTRSDVYSLGVILYQLLTGTLPFDPQTLRDAGYDGLIKIIRETEPPTPSTRLSTLAGVGTKGRRAQGAKGGSAAPVADVSAPRPLGPSDPPPLSPTEIAKRRGVNLVTLQRELHGELDWIVMKCLEKDRTRRYETANGLAMDIGRHLNDEPVIAGPPSRTYRFKKLVRRNKGVFAAAGIVAAALIVGAGLATAGFIQARRDRDLAEEQKKRAQTNETLAKSEASKAQTVIDMLNKMLSAAGEPRQEKDHDYTVRELLDEFATTLPDELRDQPEVEATVRTTIGRAYMALGEWDAAKKHLKAALDMRRAMYPQEHALVAESLSASDYGGLLLAVGDYLGAERCFREALAIRQAVFGDEQVEAAYGMVDLGLILSELGQHDEAEQLLRGAVAIERRVLGDHHENVADALSKLAHCLLRATSDTDQLVEAEALHREALAIKREIYGDDHPSVAVAMNNLTTSLWLMNDIEQGAALGRDALSILRRTYGDCNTNVVKARHNLAMMLHETGDNQGAEPLLRESVECSRQLYEPNHPFTAYCLHHWADTLRALDRFEEALPAAREAVEIYTAMPTGDESEFTHAVQVLTQTLWEAGLRDEAETAGRESLAEFRRTFPERSWAIATALSTLSMTLLEREKYAEVEPLVRECLSIRKEKLPPDDWRTFNAMSLLGGSLAGQVVELIEESLITLVDADVDGDPGALDDAIGLLDEAEPLLLEGYDGLINQPEAPELRRFQALERIVKLYDAWDAIEPNTGKAELAAEWRAKLPDPASVPSCP